MLAVFAPAVFGRQDVWFLVGQRGPPALAPHNAIPFSLYGQYDLTSMESPPT